MLNPHESVILLVQLAIKLKLSHTSVTTILSNVRDDFKFILLIFKILQRIALLIYTTEIKTPGNEILYLI